MRSVVVKMANQEQSRWRGICVACLLALAGALSDLATKSYVFNWLGLPPSPVYWIWPEYVGLETSINQGALGGLFSGRLNALSAISVLAIVAILIWLWRGDAGKDLLLSSALGLILAGILGNLYDRLGLWGVRGVRDWILFRYHQFTWPNFNLADSLLVCGAALIAWHTFRTPHLETHRARMSDSDRPVD